MERRLTEFINHHQLFEKEDRLLLGISGGRDSVCLAHLLVKTGYNVSFAHVNYHLRGDASDADQNLVEQLAEQLGTEFFVHHADLSQHTGSIQANAREIRYRFFEQLAQAHRFKWILTAHQLNDRFETALINLLRGTGMYGLTGTPVKRVMIVRPMLWASRDDIDDYISNENLTYREDESNDSDAYLRNRLRHHLMPLLKEHDSQLEAKLTTSLDQIQEDVNAMGAMSRFLLNSIGDAFYLRLDTLPSEQRQTWVYHCMRAFGFNRSDAKDILLATESGKTIETENWKALRSQNAVSILPAERNEEASIELSESDGYTSTSFQLTLQRSAQLPEKFDATNCHVYLSLEDRHFPLTIRLLRNEDTFTPLGLSYAISVRKYLLEKGASFAQISNTFVVETVDEEICWIPEWQIADSYKAAGEQSRLVSLYFKRNGH